MKLKNIITDDEPIARKVSQEFVEEIDYMVKPGVIFLIRKSFSSK